MTQAFDLGALDTQRGAEDGFDFTPQHPATGAPLPLTITVLGKDADAYQKKLGEMVRRNAERLRRNRNQLPDTDALVADNLELLAAITVRWEGVVLDGAALPCNPDNARKVYARFPWLREQLDAAVSDRANFLPRSASSS